METIKNAIDLESARAAMPINGVIDAMQGELLAQLQAEHGLAGPLSDDDYRRGVFVLYGQRWRLTEAAFVNDKS